MYGLVLFNGLVFQVDFLWVVIPVDDKNRDREVRVAPGGVRCPDYDFEGAVRLEINHGIGEELVVLDVAFGHVPSPDNTEGVATGVDHIGDLEDSDQGSGGFVFQEGVVV